MSSMKAVIINQNKEEQILLTQALQWAGLSVQAEENVEYLLLRERADPADLLIFAQETPKLEEAIKQARLFSSAPIIAIADFIPEDTRVKLYEAGADLVLVRPYSPRLFMVQAGMLAQRELTRGIPQPFQRPSLVAPLSVFVPPVHQPNSPPLYS